jgi:hypothetical protein
MSAIGRNHSGRLLERLRGLPYYALSFYEVDDGRITSAREYWVMEAYEEPRAERARWFEPM